MTYQLPPSHWSNAGYLQVNSPREQQTTRGFEAAVSFSGPYNSRHQFLDGIMGRWWVDQWICGTTQCEVFYRLPMPYLVPDVSIDPFQWRIAAWPDTYSIQADKDSKPETQIVDVPGISGVPVFSSQCAAHITVNYRSKTHADWPLWMYATCQDCVDDAPNGWMSGVDGVNDAYGVSKCISNSFSPVDDHCLGFPKVPLGTFIDVKLLSELEVQTKKEKYEIRTNLTKAEEDPDTGGTTTTDLRDVPGEGKQYNTVKIYEIEWSNLPLPPNYLENYVGKTNLYPLFGQPAYSMLLMPPLIRERRNWNFSTFDVKLRLVCKTAPVIAIGEDPCIDVSCHDYVHCGRIGLWGKTNVVEADLVDPCTYSFTSTQTYRDDDQDGCWTNWFPMRVKQTGREVFEPIDMQRMFTFPGVVFTPAAAGTLSCTGSTVTSSPGFDETWTVTPWGEEQDEIWGV